MWYWLWCSVKKEKHFLYVIECFENTLLIKWFEIVSTNIDKILEEIRYKVV